MIYLKKEDEEERIAGANDVWIDASKRTQSPELYLRSR
jgi:hypothetical protein